MKIRTDFVTNSSSSSFICFKIDNKVLAKLCRKYNLPFRVEGNELYTVNPREQQYGPIFPEDNVQLPEGGSLAQWFAEMLSCAEIKGTTKALLDELAAREDEINMATKTCDIQIADTSSEEGYATYEREVRRNGTVFMTLLDSDIWEGSDEQDLWEMLYYSADLNKVRLIAESRGHKTTREDKWGKRISLDDVADAVPSGFSLVGKTCCLTGDFDCGAKSFVEEYIQERGGKCVSSLSQKVSVLIVGGKMTDSTMSSKVMSAIERKQNGDGLLVFRESTFFDADIPKENLETAEEDSAQVGELHLTKEEAEREWTVKLTKKQCTLSEYRGSSHHIIIPAYVDDIPVMTIKKVAVNKESIYSVRVPQTVSLIQKTAFSGFTNLRKITIENDKAQIELGAFFGCTSLADSNGCVIVNGTIQECSQSGNVVLSKGFSFLPQDLLRRTAIKSVVVPEGVTAIDEWAFGALRGENIKKISLPNSLQTIGAHAFCHTAIELITIPDGVTVLPDSAFACCDNLKRVELPLSITEIGDRVFYSCSSLREIVITHGRDISDEEAREDFISSLNKVGHDIFKDIWGREVAPFVSGFKDALEARRKQIAEAKMNSHPTEESVEYVCPSTVAEAKRLFKYNYGQIDTYVGTASCVQIPETIGKMKIVGVRNWAFQKCADLTHIAIPPTVETIGGEAFEKCINLKSVTLPEGLRTIGYNAFCGCHNLESVIIPKSVVYIDSAAFKDCDKLSNVIVMNEETTFGGAVFENTAFYSDEKNWDGDFLYIGSSLVDVKKNVQDVSVMPGTKYIVNYAFGDCTELRSIKLPESLKKIGFAAFDECVNLQNITVSDRAALKGAKYLLRTDNNNMNKFYHDPTNWKGEMLYLGNTLVKCKSSDAKVVVVDPKTTIISSSAFIRHESLEEVILPPNLTTIENYAFCDCKQLKRIVIPCGVTQIESGTFSGCTNLLEVILPPNLTTIEDSAFCDCKQLKRIVIPDSVTEIKRVPFPDSITLCVTKGSYAEQYAKDSDIKYEYV